MKSNKKLLMVLGPVKMEDDILELGSLPPVYNRTEEFSLRLKNIFNNLQYIFQTVQPVILAAASGTGMMEFAVSNALSSRDTALCINGGTFGERWGKICQKLGVNLLELKVELGMPINPALIREELVRNPQIKAVFVTHNETSTGTLTDIQAIGEIVNSFSNCILVVDCISSLVVERLEMDNWHIDIVISASHKAIGIPPGLGFISFSEKALAHAQKADLKTFYWDIFEFLSDYKRNQTPWTPPIGLLYQLERRLEKIRREGLSEIQRRYSRNSEKLRRGVLDLGLDILSKNPANGVTGIIVDHFDASEIVNLLDKEYDITVAPSGGDLGRRLFRVGNLGDINETDIEYFLKSLQSTLSELNGDSRIYSDPMSISYERTHRFWQKRAMEATSTKQVLLGEGLNEYSADKRNFKEREILLTLLGEDRRLNILDVGCGIGRWVNNLFPLIKNYHGIDFSSEFIKKAMLNFEKNSCIQFFNMSATELDPNVLFKEYDLIIVNGLCMYLNDSEVVGLFSKLNSLMGENGSIYLQESISTMGTRLTLNNFYSKDLKTNYSSIYRTKDDYESMIGTELNNIKVIETNLLLDESIGQRNETNAQYWYLKRILL